MRIYHFTIIFAMFALMILFMAEIKISEQAYIDEDRNALDEACDRAADSAAAVLAKAGSTGLSGVRDAAVDSYYESLAASLAVAGYAGSRNTLRMYVPLIAVTDGNLIYVCYDDYETNSNGTTVLVRKWSGQIEEGELEDTMQYYCNRHNLIAERAGIRYEFVLPSEDGGMYLRGCEGTGFYALFQGYQINGTKNEYYNRFSFSGTGLEYAAKYYINLEGTGYASPAFFHREDCVYRTEDSIVYTQRRECALAGAYECPECGGDGY